MGGVNSLMFPIFLCGFFWAAFFDYAFPTERRIVYMRTQRAYFHKLYVSLVNGRLCATKPTSG